MVELRGNILIILKSLIGEINPKNKNKLCFEKENIKCDNDYYQIISSYFDIMILHFHKMKSFDSKNFQRIFYLLRKIINILQYLD